MRISRGRQCGRLPDSVAGLLACQLERESSQECSSAGTSLSLLKAHAALPAPQRVRERPFISESLRLQMQDPYQQYPPPYPQQQQYPPPQFPPYGGGFPQGGPGGPGPANHMGSDAQDAQDWVPSSTAIKHCHQALPSSTAILHCHQALPPCTAILC